MISTRGLTDEQLKAEVQRQARLANQRIRRARAAGGVVEAAPAYRPFFSDKPEKLFSIRNKNRIGLIQELRRVESFLDDKTSTIRGARQWARQMSELTGIDFTDKQQMNDFWEGFNRWRHENVEDALGSPKELATYSALYQMGRQSEWRNVSAKLADAVSSGVRRSEIDELTQKLLNG